MADGGSVSQAAALGGGGGEGPGRESWELFSNWACCVCVVTFDLELGQALEVLVFQSVCLYTDMHLRVSIRVYSVESTCRYIVTIEYCSV